jgi:hypothetical protein
MCRRSSIVAAFQAAFLDRIYTMNRMENPILQILFILSNIWFRLVPLRLGLAAAQRGE